MLVGNVLASKSVVRAIPDSPASSRFHTASIECHIGVTQPIPVMTTLFMVRVRLLVRSLCRPLPACDQLSHLRHQLLRHFHPHQTGGGSRSVVFFQDRLALAGIVVVGNGLGATVIPAWRIDV